MASSFCNAPSSSDSSSTSDGASGSSHGGNGHTATSSSDQTQQPKARLEVLTTYPCPVKVKLKVTFESEQDGTRIFEPYSVNALEFTTVGLHVQEFVECFSEKGKRKRTRWDTADVQIAYDANKNELENEYAPFLDGLIETAEIMKKCQKMCGRGRSSISGEVTLAVPPPIAMAVPDRDHTNGAAATPAVALSTFSALSAALPPPVTPAVPAADRDWNGSLVFRGRPEHN